MSGPVQGEKASSLSLVEEANGKAAPLALWIGWPLGHLQLESLRCPLKESCGEAEGADAPAGTVLR